MTVKMTGSFLNRVQKNKRIKKFYKLRESGVFAINTDGYMKQILALHGSKKFRNAEGKVILASAQKVLIEGSAENNANRSTLAGIKLTCFQAKRLVNESIEEATNYLKTRYADQLKNEYRTIGDREAAIYSVLQDFHKLNYKLDTVIGMADIAIIDIDKSAWIISAINDTLKLTSQKER